MLITTIVKNPLGLRATQKVHCTFFKHQILFTQVPEQGNVHTQDFDVLLWSSTDGYHITSFFLCVLGNTVGDITTTLGFFIFIFDQEPCRACGEKLSAFFVLESLSIKYDTQIRIVRK